MSYNKFYLYKKQVSYDGVTWEDVIPLEQVPSGESIGTYETLEECEGVPPTPVQYRWVNLDPAVDYYCSGTTKYYKQQKQVSYDSGTTWENVVPAEYQWGGIAQTQSTDCGYVPPVFDGKFSATYSDGRTYSAACDSSTVLTSATTKPSGYQYSAMTEAIIGDCVTSIKGYAAFSSCTSLTSIDIPNSVTYIGDKTFYQCSRLTRLNSDIDGVFNIPDSVTAIGQGAFYDCSGLTSITIPNSVRGISGYAFAYCDSLTSIEIPSGVTTIQGGVFIGCHSLTSVTIPNSVTKIIGDAFNGCSGLTSITIPDSVTYIGWDAFNSCSGMTTCTIGSGVTSIGRRAFQDCTSLTSITVNATTPPTFDGTNAFDNTNECPIYVPAASVNAYKTASGWSSYSSRIQALP